MQHETHFLKGNEVNVLIYNLVNEPEGRHEDLDFKIFFIAHSFRSQSAQSCLNFLLQYNLKEPVNDFL